MASVPSLAERIRRQALHCRQLGSPLTSFLLDQLARDYEAGGRCRDLLRPWAAGRAANNMLGHRVAGALHFLVLSGDEPGLAAFYPSMGGSFSRDGFWRMAQQVLREQWDFVRAYIDNPPQTNEIGRAGTLLGGFLSVARDTRLPLRCLELGASAGLLLQWDRYRYNLDRAAWGDPDSPVRIRNVWTDPPSGLPAEVLVAERRGCDISPVDLEDADARLRLRSFIWGDHPRRLVRLDAAIELARRHPVPVDRGDAAGWIAQRLAEPRPGMATVVYSCFASLYFDRRINDRIGAALRSAADAATAEAPFTVMQLEGAGANGEPQLFLQTWPGGRKRLLATADILGFGTTWLKQRGTR